jgi:CHASE3 domain sensor protein
VPIQFSKKQKLFIPIAILAAILIFLGSVILYNSYEKIHLLQQLNEKITFSTKIATAVHNLQNERGLSCGYILDRNSTFNIKLSRQKEKTDNILSDLKHFISVHNDIPQSEKKYILATIAPLKNIRILIQRQDLTYNEIIRSYTFMTESFLQMIAQIASTSHIPKITSEILAYSSLLYMKEYRGTERALGVTMFLPEEDRYSHSKRHLDSQISSLFGGRLAEELVFGADKVTTGASNDIERATDLARNMVTKWGLSDKLGPLSYSEDEGEVFLGRSVTQHKNLSDETAHAAWKFGDRVKVNKILVTIKHLETQQIEESEFDIEEIEKELMEKRHYASSNRWTPTNDIKNGFIIKTRHTSLISDAAALDYILF